MMLVGVGQAADSSISNILGSSIVVSSLTIFSCAVHCSEFGVGKTSR